ncbi:MAG TPA: nucleotidyltransferase [Holosporales bacterium]|nr:nucleotidyltransferase [Holosporales bacterium]
MDAIVAESFQKFEKALTSLSAIVTQPMREDRSNIDATIQRFEFTIELFWKLLKRILYNQGVIVQYPRDVLKEAYAGGLIDDEQIWLSMLSDRNQTSHTYDEDLADQIYLRIQKYTPIFQKTLQNIRRSFGEL